MKLAFRILCFGLSLAAIASCAPLPVIYYAPAAEGAKVAPDTCVSQPPYKAIFSSPELDSSASFNGKTIWLDFYTRNTSHIVLQPSALAAEADGVPVALLNSNYSTALSTYSGPSPETGYLDFSTNSLNLHADIAHPKPEVLLVHIPPVTVNSVTLPARTVQFNRVMRVKLLLLLGNC